MKVNCNSSRQGYDHSEDCVFLFLAMSRRNQAVSTLAERTKE